MIWAISTCFAACSCITGGESHDDQTLQNPTEQSPPSGATGANAEQAAPSTGDKPRVMANWQQTMNELLRERPAGEEAYGLFSYGGWANAGQFMVFINQERTGGQLALVEPSSKKINKDRSLTGKELERLLTHLKGIENLQDFIPQGAVFDAIEYELVKVRLESGQPVAVKRIYMQNPGGTGKNASEPHMALIQAFEMLRTPDK